jgi:hypothetical protein
MLAREPRFGVSPSGLRGRFGLAGDREWRKEPLALAKPYSRPIARCLIGTEWSKY